MSKPLLVWRMGGVALSDPPWFVALYWWEVVNMEVIAVGCFVLIVF